MGKQLLPTAAIKPLALGSYVASVIPLNTVEQPLKVNLAISVPKKFVKRAVWRNYAKRVAREAWRNLSVPFVQQELAPYFVLLRLRQLPTPQMLGAIAGVKAVKRQLRLECDQVLGRLSRDH